MALSTPRQTAGDDSLLPRRLLSSRRLELVIQCFSCVAERSGPRTGSPAPRKRCESSSYPSFSPFPRKFTPLHVVHHREQFPNDFHHHWPHCNHEQGGQNTKEDGEHQ